MHFRLLRKLGVCFQLKFYEYHYHLSNASIACYFKNNSLRNYKLTLLGLMLTAFHRLLDFFGILTQTAPNAGHRHFSHKTSLFCITSTSLKKVIKKQCLNYIRMYTFNTPCRYSV